MIDKLIRNYKITSEVSKELPEFIRSLEINQELIYTELGISRSTFHRLLNNPENFTLCQLVKISNLLNKHM